MKIHKLKIKKKKLQSFSRNRQTITMKLFIKKVFCKRMLI